jgi:hypothetical protein
VVFLAKKHRPDAGVVSIGRRPKRPVSSDVSVACVEQHLGGLIEHWLRPVTKRHSGSLLDSTRLCRPKLGHSEERIRSSLNNARVVPVER